GATVHRGRPQDRLSHRHRPRCRHGRGEAGCRAGCSRARIPRSLRMTFLRANRVTLIASVITAGLAGAVFFGMAHSRDVTSVWELLAKLTPFVAASIAIAWLDRDWAARLRLHLVLPPLCFLVFFMYFVPRIFHYHNENNFDQLYYTILMLVPFIILSLVLSA